MGLGLPRATRFKIWFDIRFLGLANLSIARLLQICKSHICPMGSHVKWGDVIGHCVRSRLPPPILDAHKLGNGLAAGGGMGYRFRRIPVRRRATGNFK